MVRHALLFYALLASAGTVLGQPLRLIAEAEDFVVEKGAWQRVPFRENYFAGTFAITFLSRMACLAAPAQVEPGQEAVAVQRVDIAHDGDFHVLARYEQPYNFAVEFTVEIEQQGRRVFKEQYGRLEDPRIWAFNGHKPVAMERYGWGGTDNIVWQDKGTARLSRGPTTIRLIAGPQLDGGKPRAMAARRHVDVICLTDDLAGMEAQQKTNYLELDGWLVQDGDLYVRVTNPRDGLGPCVPVLAPVPEGQHSPYYIHIRDWPTTRVLKSGQLVEAKNYLLTGPRTHAVRQDLLAPLLDLGRYSKSDPKDPKAAPALAIPDQEYLQRGDSSGWVPLGQALDALNNSQWYPQAEYKHKVDGLHLQLEFAVPDGKGGLKPVREVTVRGKPSYYSDVTFELPGNVAANPLIRTQVEALRWLRGEVDKFPNKGPVARNLPIYGILDFSAARNVDGPIGEEATRLALALGDNTMVGKPGSWAAKLGVPQRRSLLVAHWPAGTVAKEYAVAEKAGHAANIKIVSYGDEIHIAPLAPEKGKEAEFNGRFVAWLQQRKVVGAEKATFTRNPGERWYYYSSLYATEAGIAHYAEETKFLESKSKDILIGANYSPHANYMVTELQYVRPFKARAMTMPWGEDYIWQIPEFSTQVAGYLVSGFRAGAKYHNLPIMMYVMPHSPGTTPRDFRLSFYTCIAHGTRLVNYFCATPGAVNATENYVATDDVPMFRALHAVSHEAGVFEDYVVKGKVRPARVGLLLSSVDEILTGDNNFKGGIHNAERKAIYYALRHAQVPVDFLTEDDVIEGQANDYQVIYVTQQHLHARAIQALQRWAVAGGTVVALCGGGLSDEFGAANPEALALYGLKDQKLDKDPKLTQVLFKQDLPAYQPLDRVKWGTGSEVPVLLWKQTLVPADGQVVGTYQGGAPAVVQKSHGKGRAILFGFFPGMAYVRSGLPLRPVDRGAVDSAYSHFVPTEMDVSLRQRLVSDLLPGGFVRPIDCSVTLVETTCIDTPASKRLAVPLLNYSGKAIENLTVTIAALPDVRSVRSVERGVLKHERRDGGIVVTLPLDVADMLLIDR